MKPDEGLLFACMELILNLISDKDIKLRNTLSIQNTVGEIVDPDSGYTIDRNTIGTFSYVNPCKGRDTNTAFLAYGVLTKTETNEKILVVRSYYKKHNQLKFPISSPHIKAGKVHPYVHDLLENFGPRITDLITQFTASVDSVLFTGFSNAGKVAKSLYLYTKETIQPVIPVRCISFCSPRVGDEGVARALTDGNVWEISMTKDFVDFAGSMPPHSFGYRSGGEVIEWPSGRTCAAGTAVISGGDDVLAYYSLLCVIPLIAFISLIVSILITCT